MFLFTFITFCVIILKAFFKEEKKRMSSEKWVAVFGNSPSIADNRLERYSKNVSFRYFFKSTISGSKIRVHFSNFCGPEDVVIDKANIALAIDELRIDTNSLVPLTFGGQNSVTICSGEEIISDEIDFDVKSDCNYFISYYLKDFKTPLRGFSFFSV